MPSPLETLPRSFVLAERLAPQTPARRFLRLFVEGMFFTGCALLLARALGVAQSGFFAVFLAAAGPVSRVDELLGENRRQIAGGERPARANALAALHCLALFVGAFAAFFLAALWMGEARMRTEYAFVLEVARLGGDTILTRPFRNAPGLFVNNAIVLAVFFGLSFIYRSYGTLLSLAWNACVWGLVIAFLVRRGLAGSAVHPALFVAVSTLAVLPHLLLEAAGYMAGALAAIFLSKAIVKYEPGDAIFRGVARSAVALLGAALLLLLAGALAETTLPRLVLSRLAG